jgi:hypothetical protein
MNALLRRAAVAAFAAGVTLAGAAAAQEITVYKSPACGCCGKWIEHMRNNGFDVRDIAAINSVKTRYGVPTDMRSCHTGVVEGYVIEGHVPASDIRRLLNERPKVAGLPAPGMPIGAPGMEVAKAQPYTVMSFEKDGATAVFAKH